MKSQGKSLVAPDLYDMMYLMDWWNCCDLVVDANGKRRVKAAVRGHQFQEVRFS